MRRVVLKFGGTSVGIAANFAQAVALVAARTGRDERPPIVVVSALAGVTNLLVEFCALPSRNFQSIGLMLALSTLISTSPGPACGRGIESRCNCSGPP